MHRGGKLLRRGMCPAEGARESNVGGALAASADGVVCAVGGSWSAVAVEHHQKLLTAALEADALVHWCERAGRSARPLHLMYGEEDDADTAERTKA